jgi:hypothetical protein
MSIAERYARPKPLTSLNAETLRQVQGQGQQLAANGVTQDKTLGHSTPTPVQRYGRPENNHVLKSRLAQRERPHALSPDSNIGQQKLPSQSR